MSTTITGQQRTLQSEVTLVPEPSQGPIAQVFSLDGVTTLTQTVVTSQIYHKDSQSVADGTTADSNATYVGTNGGTPMFAIKNPNGSNPPNLNNALEAPPIPATTNEGFNDNGTISQGLIGNL